MARIMSQAPESPPGTKYQYSNVGYALAGLMAEQVTGQAWEDLMRERLFRPLGMSSAGYGAPGTPGQVDQPWGHDDKETPVQFDNAPALGPAGTVHCTMADWAKFVGMHLRDGEGTHHVLNPRTFRLLHTPPAGGDYAGGWIVGVRPWAGGTTLSHDGSNTTWYCTAWLAPAHNVAYLVVANRAGDPAAKACDEGVQGLIQRTASLGRGPGAG
jgi:CubicO group peptidase (beta-lactamase class C family)